MVDQSVAVVSMHVVRAGPSRVFTPAAAGTDANVRCQLVGAKSTSALLYLQKSNHLNKFERGQACKRPLPLQMPSYTAFPLVLAPLIRVQVLGDVFAHELSALAQRAGLAPTV